MSETPQTTIEDSVLADQAMPATLQRGTTAQFAWKWSDAGSGAHEDVSIWRPEPEDGWYVLGDYAQGDYTKPVTSAITVRQVGLSDTPLLKPPVGFRRVWTDQGSRGDHNGAIWYPEPPPGYVSLGCVAAHGYSPPELTRYACVALYLVEQTTVGQHIWSDKGSGADQDVTLYPPEGENAVFVAQGNYSPWVGTAYRLKTS